jgi:hypothetical protein
MRKRTATGSLILLTITMVLSCALDFQPTFGQDYGNITPPPPRPRRAYSTVEQYNYSHGGDVYVEQARKAKKKKIKKAVVKAVKEKLTATEGKSNKTGDRSSDKSTDNASLKGGAADSPTSGKNGPGSKSSDRTKANETVQKKQAKDLTDSVMTKKSVSKESSSSTLSKGTTGGTVSSITNSTADSITGSTTGSATGEKASESESTKTPGVDSAQTSASGAETPVKPSNSKISSIPPPQMPPPPTSIGGFSTNAKISKHAVRQESEN